MEPKLELKQRHGRSVKIDLTDAQDEALRSYIACLHIPKVSYAQAVLALVIEALQARKLLPEDEEPTP